MSSPSKSLDELRLEIDEVDAALHDLIMRRTALVERVGALKSKAGPALRPGREAEIVRRLAARHKGPFPLAALVRIWREMIAALTGLQGPFAIAAFAPGDLRTYWDLARDHYGSTTPITAANSHLGVVRAVSEGTATVGVLPWPDDEEAAGDPWWRYLFSEDAKTPRVVARLPFLVPAKPSKEEADAVVLALVAPEPTGDDRTLLGLELSENISRGRLKDMLEGCGLPPLQFRTVHLPDAGGAVHLVELDGFVRGDDSRLAALGQRLGETLVRALPVGVYARPVALAPAGRRGAKT